MARIRPVYRFLLAAALVAAFVALGASRGGDRARAAVLGGGSPTLSINDVSAAESVATQTFTVTLSASSVNTVTVDYATADGTAVAGQDYTATSGTLTFNPGDLTKTIPVSITSDPFDEDNETFTVNLSNPSGATVADGQGVGTITDDDPLTVVAVNDVAVVEGTGGTSNLTFTITLTPKSGKTVSVRANTADDTALAGTDYTAVDTTVTFLPGETSHTVSVPITTDAIDEPNESLFLRLSNLVNCRLGDNLGVGGIADDDDPPTVSLIDVSVLEGNSGTSNASFIISLSGPSSFTVTVDAATSNGSAIVGSDYAAVSAPGITFNPGDTMKTVVVPVNGDAAYELNEDFFLNVFNPVNASIADGAGQGIILNDDSLPSLSINDRSVTEGDSGTVNALFTVTLSPAAGIQVQVDVVTGDGTATAPADYQPLVITRTFSPGETTKTVTVPVNGDTLDEADADSFFVRLISAQNATVTDGEGQGTIQDDDAAPTVSVAGNATVIEGNSGITNATFTVNLSRQSGRTVTVDFGTADETATSPSDYASTTGTLTFPPGVTAQTFSVPVNGDMEIEPNETFTVNLSNAVNTTIATGQATGNILNDDPLPALSINDRSVTEGDTGTVTAMFTVTLSRPSAALVQFDFFTADGTAASPGDYQGLTGTRTFTPGDTTKTVSIPVNGDILDEDDETFFVRLTGAQNATIADDEGLGTILDDDVPPTVSLGANAAVPEGNAGTTNATFTISLSRQSGRTVTVDVATADGSATAPSDYVAATTTLSFAPGQTSKSFPVAVNGDVLVEPNETFTVNLSNPVNTVINNGQASGIILNDDTGPALSISDVTVTEVDQGGTSIAKFKVTLSPTSSSSVTVAYATADGTATAGPDPGLLSGQSDYRAKSGTLSFSAGAASRTISVTVNGDTLGEPNETFFVNLTGPTGAVLQDPQGVGTIKNDEAAGACTILGTNGADTINGTSGDDIICGQGGNDVIHGMGGNDTITGSGGVDQLFGDDGNDVIHGNDANDTIDGGAGNDQLFGDGGNDSLNSTDGVGGNDSIDGGTGTDTATSDPGDTVTHAP